MIEDVLAEYTAEGFVVTNTFQKTAAEGGVFGPVGWDVYIRNDRNTRSGHGSGDTMEAALRAAFRIAMEGPTYELPQRAEGGATLAVSRRPVFAPSPPKLILEGTAESDELF
jgi:hypothetical protein